jgi:hypothetical protein
MPPVQHTLQKSPQPLHSLVGRPARGHYRVMLELQVKKFFASPDHCDKFGCKSWIF